MAAPRMDTARARWGETHRAKMAIAKQPMSHSEEVQDGRP
jgi:hypothetical protein